MSRPAGVWTDARSASSTSRSAHDGRAAAAAGHQPDVRDACPQRGAEDRLLVAAVRGDDHGGRAGGQGRLGGRSPARTCRPKSRSARTSAVAIGACAVHRHDRQRHRGLEQDLQGAAGQARVVHGDDTVLGRSGGSSPAAPGLIRSSRVSPVDRTSRAWARTVDSAHSPPTKPLISPSARTRAESPALALVGRWARTTVAHTNG